jgi:tRNA(Ile)-lysidine synthase
MNISQKVLAFFNKHSIAPNEANFYVACSGGKDSMLLIDMFLKLELKPILLHCNFNLRGNESQRDETFVQQYAVKHNLVYYIKNFDTNTYAKENQLNTQEAARALRYSWFKEIIISNKLPNSYLVMAHHLQDQVETLLLNFTRGTGIAGLQGMPENFKADGITIIRPLIEVDAELLSLYSKENNLEWVEDSSNETITYSRNFIRHKVLPLLKDRNPHIGAHILGTKQQLYHATEVYNYHTQWLTKNLLKKQLGNIPLAAAYGIPINLILKLKIPVVLPLFIDFGFAPKQTFELEKLMVAKNGSILNATYSNWQLIKYNQWLLLNQQSLPKEETKATMLFITKEDRSLIYLNSTLTISHTQQLPPFSKNENEIVIDADVISFPMVLRPIKQGDYMYPLGMPKKKKIARILIDLKVPNALRSQQLVLETNQKIVWLVGHKLSEKFKTTPNSKNFMILKFKEGN